MAGTVQHGVIARQADPKKPRASASFDARRLWSFRRLLDQVLAEGNPSYAVQVEQECRRLAAGLIAGEPVEA